MLTPSVPISVTSASFSLVIAVPSNRRLPPDERGTAGDQVLVTLRAARILGAAFWRAR
jgi:hypothetical protein